jgi:hypothetical protein
MVVPADRQGQLSRVRSGTGAISSVAPDNLLIAALGEVPLRCLRTRVRFPPPPLRGVHKTTPLMFTKPRTERSERGFVVLNNDKLASRTDISRAVWNLIKCRPRSGRAKSGPRA